MSDCGGRRAGRGASYSIPVAAAAGAARASGHNFESRFLKRVAVSVADERDIGLEGEKSMCGKIAKRERKVAEGGVDGTLSNETIQRKVVIVFRLKRT
ncbi:hypothetical protein J6590_017511 [Homalodisca vitripennis]|nr:hypothetical protein J6590_017511 [Homalodisca vitripennis]